MVLSFIKMIRCGWGSWVFDTEKWPNDSDREDTQHIYTFQELFNAQKSIRRMKKLDAKKTELALDFANLGVVRANVKIEKVEETQADVAWQFQVRDAGLATRNRELAVAKLFTLKARS